MPDESTVPELLNVFDELTADARVRLEAGEETYGSRWTSRDNLAEAKPELADAINYLAMGLAHIRRAEAANHGMTKCARFLVWLLKQVGRHYRYGAEARLRASDFGNPNGFSYMVAWDCSELVQAGLWAAGIGKVWELPVSAFDGAGNQFLNTREIPLGVARKHLGSLVFIQDPSAYPTKPARIGHVGVIVAEDTVLEARGSEHGVVIGPLRQSFNRASKVDELHAS